MDKKREKGVVKWFDPLKRYGFITMDVGNRDLFVHQSALESLESVLEKGDRVEFEVEESDKGPIARHVFILENEES
jgi:cold shock protein